MLQDADFLPQCFRLSFACVQPAVLALGALLAAHNAARANPPHRLDTIPADPIVLRLPHADKEEEPNRLAQCRTGLTHKVAESVCNLNHSATVKQEHHLFVCLLL